MVGLQVVKGRPVSGYDFVGQVARRAISAAVVQVGYKYTEEYDAIVDWVIFIDKYRGSWRSQAAAAIVVSLAKGKTAKEFARLVCQWSFL